MTEPLCTFVFHSGIFAVMQTAQPQHNRNDAEGNPSPYVLPCELLSYDPFEYDTPLSALVRLRMRPGPEALCFEVGLEMLAPSWADDAARWPSVVNSLKVEPSEGAAEERLTAGLVRSIRFGEIHQFVHVGLVQHYLKFADPEVDGGKARWAEMMRQNGPVDSTLREVAAIYRHAESMGARPVKMVTETFDLPRTTATRWVRMAREKGFLEPKKGG